MLLSATGICKIWEWYLGNCGQTANKQRNKWKRWQTRSVWGRMIASLWHTSIIFETLHGKVAKTRVNVLNSFDRCKTFANIRNLHEGTENHMCPFALTILPLKHFNSHDFKLEQMNKGKMETLAVQNVRVHIYSGWGQKWYIIMWQYCSIQGH